MFNSNDLQVTKWGTLKVDFHTMESNLSGVFAAGDIVRGASLVVWAIRDGRDVAESISKIFRAKKIKNFKSCIMKRYLKIEKILEESHAYSKSMEHDACGVGLIASTEGKKSRKVVEYGINALKAVFHRGAVDADGKTGDGAGIHLEIPSDFLLKK